MIDYRNLTPYEVISDMEEKRRELSELNSELSKEGFKMDECERVYLIKKAKLEVILRENKTPIGLIKDLVAGDSEVVNAMYEYKKHFHNYEVLKSKIRFVSQEIEVDRSYLTFLRAEMNSN